MCMLVSIRNLFYPFSFYKEGNQDQQKRKHIRYQRNRIPGIVGCRFKTEFNPVLPGRNRHATQYIIYAHIIRFVAVEIGVPSLVVIHFTEYCELVCSGRKQVINFIIQIFNQFQGR